LPSILPYLKKILVCNFSVIFSTNNRVYCNRLFVLPPTCTHSLMRKIPHTVGPMVRRSTGRLLTAYCFKLRCCCHLRRRCYCCYCCCCCRRCHSNGGFRSSANSERTNAL